MSGLTISLNCYAIIIIIIIVIVYRFIFHLYSVLCYFWSALIVQYMALLLCAVV